MLSMAAIGIALLLGIATRLAAGAGIVWMVLFYTASAISPENNRSSTTTSSTRSCSSASARRRGRYLGLGRRWEQLGFVQKHPILR